ncbi:YjbQ family protein [Candidatus Woesearchaeota archaeon]|nr:YjbQ family protein [Candidatus Woesearchaeota archaeon]
MSTGFPLSVLSDSEPLVLNVSAGQEISTDGIEKVLGREPLHSELDALRRIRVVRLTDQINSRIAGYGLGPVSGFVEVYDRHTTTLLAVNEPEERLFEDIAWRLIRENPLGYFRHDDFNARTELRDDGEAERHNGWAHLVAYFKPRDLRLEVKDGKLSLGKWQEPLFIDLDANPPQERYLSLQLFYGLNSR